MSVKRYRKLPVEVEAVQFTWPMLPSGKGGNFFEVEQFLGDSYAGLRAFGETRGATYPCFFITTLEGEMRCDPMDYIIRGVKGEHYPCKPDIFEATYEEVAA